MALVEFPGDMRVDLLLVDRVVDLLEENVDAAVRIGKLNDSSQVAVPLGSVRRIVCASPDYLQRVGVPLTPQSLRDHCCVAFTGFSVGGSWEFDLASQSKRVPVEARLAVNNVEAAVDACCAGLGVGAFLDYQVRDALHQGKLVRLLESYERAAVPINLLVLQLRTASPRVRSFIDWAVPRLRERLRRPR